MLFLTPLPLVYFDLDIDSNGRWSVEKFKGLLFQIERDANAIAQRTRRGKGNIIMCSADVASALTMAGVLDYTPALNDNLNVCLLYTSPSPRDQRGSRMPSSA